MNKSLFFSTLTTLALVSPFHGAYAETDKYALANMDDGASITMTGKIKNVDGNEFDLDHGDGTVQVELNGWEWAHEGKTPFKEGDIVSVSGEVDDEFARKKVIDAKNIYQVPTYTYYFIVDDNPAYSESVSATMNKEDGSFFSMRGMVKKIDNKKFVLSNSNGQITVDTKNMYWNPMKPEASRPLEVGDRIYVYGEVDDEFFQDRELSATSLIKIEDASRS